MYLVLYHMIVNRINNFPLISTQLKEMQEAKRQEFGKT